VGKGAPGQAEKWRPIRGRGGRPRCARAFRRRPGQAEAASETPGSGGFAGGAGAGTGSLRGRSRRDEASAGSWRRGRGGCGERITQGRSLCGEMSKGRGRCEETPEGRHVAGRDGTEVPGTSPGRHVRGGAPGAQVGAVELYSRIARVSLHSKPLTDGTGVTSHEETWSSTRLPHLTVTFPSSPSRTSPADAPRPRPWRLTRA